MKAKFLLVLVAITLTLVWRVNAQTYDTNGDFVQTFAGSGEQGYVDGQGQLTKFSGPSQIVADTSSNLYVWDGGNLRIRKITPSGTVSTLAGGGIDYEEFSRHTRVLPAGATVFGKPLMWTSSFSFQIFIYFSS
jgi:hypothetical protein